MLHKNLLQHKNDSIRKQAFLILLVTILFFPHISSFAASSLKIKYNNKTVTHTRQQVSVRLNGKSISLDETPGLELLNSKKEEIYMVPVVEVFQKGLGATYTSKNNKITLFQFGTTIEMTVGSTTAYVNGVKKTISFAPTQVTYVNAKKTKLLVPARFVAENLGYKYTWVNNSSTSGTIHMTSPYTLFYDDQWQIYSGIQGAVSYNGNNINVSSLGNLSLNNTVYLQANTVFAKSAIKASYKYDSKTKRIRLIKGDQNLLMTLDLTTATLNGESMELEAAPKLIKNSKNNKNYVMVPVQVASLLGLSYNWDTSSNLVELLKGDEIYFDWNAEEDTITEPEPTLDPTIEPTNEPSNTVEPTVLPSSTPELMSSPQPSIFPYAENTEESVINIASELSATMEPDVIEPLESTEEPEVTIEPSIEPTLQPIEEPEEEEQDSIIRITGGYEEGREVIRIIASNNFMPEVSAVNTTIKITTSDMDNLLGKRDYSVSDVIALKKVAISTKNNETTITITKTANSTYEIEEEDTIITIYIDGERKDNTTIATPNKIKIAVDCGHGAYTAGKRTPPIPRNLDFNNDGVIDAYKGSQIKEHVANVGVGKFLVEELTRCGFDVYQSAFGDEDIPLTTRQSNIRNAGADYSISIHFNAMGDGKTFNGSNGAQVFYYANPSYAGDSKNFAQSILNEIVKGTPQKNNGINGGHTFAMCKATTMGTKASILVECAFMTNLHEMETMMASEAYWRETAREIAQGVCNYVGVPYIAK